MTNKVKLWSRRYNISIDENLITPGPTVEFSTKEDLAAFERVMSFVVMERDATELNWEKIKDRKEAKKNV